MFSKVAAVRFPCQHLLILGSNQSSLERTNHFFNYPHPMEKMSPKSLIPMSLTIHYLLLVKLSDRFFLVFASGVREERESVSIAGTEMRLGVVLRVRNSGFSS